LDLINDILDLSKIEAGKLNLELFDFDLHNLIEDVADLTAYPAQKKGLGLGCLIHSNVPKKVIGDPVRLRQILINLTGNAVKFTRQGEVMINVRRVDSDEAPCRLTFDIIDTGIGISQDGMERIFDSYTQAENSTTRNFGGTGLGLAICKQLVDIMGGEIKLESAEGQGSTFSFTVDLEGRAVQEEKHNLQGLRVLCADNEPAILTILEHYITMWGMKFKSAENGGRALELLTQASCNNRPYDLVITNTELPVMNGETLAMTLRENETLADIPVILMGSLYGGRQPNLDRPLFMLNKPVRRSLLLKNILCAVGKGHEQHTCDSDDRIDEKKMISRDNARQSKRILVAEDNPVNQKLIRALLQKLGYAIDIVNNGLDVLEALKQNDYDLVLMDCLMPEMDGYEATRIIREQEGDEKKHLPIIALTASAMGSNRQRCLGCGMDDFITKPFRIQDLTRLLDTLLLSTENKKAPTLQN